MTTTQITPDHGATIVAGTRVKVTGCSTDYVVGFTGTLVKPYEYTGDNPPWAYFQPDDGFESGPHENGQWVIESWVPIDIEEGYVREIRERDEKIAALEAQVAQAQLNERHANIRTQDVVSCIGSHLIDAAERNDMCSIYDREVTAANEQLEEYGVSLPERRRRTAVRVRVTGEVYRDITVYVWTTPGQDASALATDPDEWTNEYDGAGIPDVEDELNSERDEHGWDSTRVTLR